MYDLFRIGITLLYREHLATCSKASGESNEKQRSITTALVRELRIPHTSNLLLPKISGHYLLPIQHCIRVTSYFPTIYHNLSLLTRSLFGALAAAACCSSMAFLAAARAAWRASYSNSAARTFMAGKGKAVEQPLWWHHVKSNVEIW